MKKILCLIAILFCSVSPAQEPDPKKTDWFKDHRYGVFVHYLNSCQNSAESLNSLGRETSWDECVREFDVEKFAERMQETGAGYVFFTIMQQSRFMIAPNATFDRLTGYKPGEACATRDLIEDLYQALHKRNIDLMLYYTGDATSADPQAAAGLKVQFPVTEEFVRNWAAVAAEYGERYKDKVRGYWVDGCYTGIGYNDHLLKILGDGLRAGNPDRIVAFNPGVDPGVHSHSRWEDYTCGEMNTFADLPKSRFVDGKQWHLLSFLGKWWGAPGVALSRQELADYVFTVNELGGVVSIDVMLYRDGELDRSQLEVLRTLRKKLAEKDAEKNAWKEGKAVPPTNLAWKKYAKLKSNDGTRILVPSVGEAFGSTKGVDGDLNTCAIAGGDWAWTYDVHFFGIERIQRVVVHFGRGYATEFEVFRVDGEGVEHSLGRFEQQEGKSVDLRFEPAEAAAIRVRSYKPDGPNQPGVQMSIAELEVYE